MQPDLIGGRYRVMSAIGRGGMGTVWLCRDEVLHRDVAVKGVGLLPGESVTDSARALREARSSAALSHRNVVTVFDVVEESGRIWLVMEHVPGRSLSQIIQQDGPLDPAMVADIGAEVAAGIAATHAAGTTHRDIKPGNILIRDDGAALISDFGIARNAADPALTESGLLTGTPSYFAPELARGAEPGPATDVWALGATLYAAVEGHPPFEQQANPVAVLHEIASTQPAPPQRADYLEPALARMMDPDPTSRWSMGDAAQVLRRIADEHSQDRTLESTLPSSVRPEPAPPNPNPNPKPKPKPSPKPAPTPVSSRPPARQRARPRTRTLVAGALVVLVVGLVLALAPRGADRPEAGSGSGSSTAGTSKKKSSDSSEGTSTSTSTSAAAEKEAFVRDYYEAAPGGSDEAWEMLGPGEQAQGRESYDRFWRTIRSVDVRSVEAGGDGNTVDVTLTYRSTDGSVSTEHKREGLIEDGDGGYLLDSDVPAG